MNGSVLGSRIKAERRQQGITLEKLAERIGISRNFLWEIEAGRKSPALHTLYNLSVTLNVSIDYLMGISNEKKHIDSNSVPQERELRIAEILDQLNHYGNKELLFISNMLYDFEKYMK